MTSTKGTPGVRKSPRTVETLPRLAVRRSEAAAMCGVSVDTITRAKNAGVLRAKKTDRGKSGANGEEPKAPAGRELYTVADLQAWLEGLPDA